MQNQSNVLKWSVIVGIVIVLNLFFNYTLSLVYESPEYESFCPSGQVVVLPDNQNECVAQGGQWTDDAYHYGKPLSVAEDRPSGYCDLHYTCRQGFEAANESYQRNVFIVLVALGALSVFLGNYFGANMVISQGLALGGVLSFVIASMRYWGAADDLFRVIILAISLALLFWIALRKFNERVRS